MKVWITLSLNQIVKNWKALVKTEESRSGWIRRFEEEIAGIRRNYAIEKESLDAGKEEWHREWMEGHLRYFQREIKKRERYIRELKALVIDV